MVQNKQHVQHANLFQYPIYSIPQSSTLHAAPVTMTSCLIHSPLYLSYSLLSAYCLSGCLLEHFAVFRGWQVLISSSGSPGESTISDLGSTEEKERAGKDDNQQQKQQQLKQQLRLLQRINGYAIAALYVLPKAVLTVLNAYLDFNYKTIVACYGSSPAVPITRPWFDLERSISLSAYLLTSSWLQSFCFMIPLQLKIREKAEQEDVDTLVMRSWLRVGFLTAHAAGVFWTIFMYG